MTNFGLRALLLLLAVVLFIVGALMDTGDDTKVDLLYWGLAVFAASFVAESIPLGNWNRSRDRT
jgi:hypothetical protein